MIRRLVREERGATVVEFAIMLIPLCTLLLGTIDIGYRMYVTSMVQGTLQFAAREAAIGNRSGAQIEQLVKQRMAPVVKPEHVSITVRSYREFGGRNRGEKLIDDKNGNGRYDSGDCWEDFNDNGRYDEAIGAGREDLAGAEDVLFYQIAVTAPRLVPIHRFIGGESTQTVVGNTMVRNQPFARRTPPATRCG